MYRYVFLQSSEGFGAKLIEYDSNPMPYDLLGNTFIFSLISDAFDSVKETVSEVVDTVSDAAESVSDVVSDGFEATRNYVNDVASGDKEIDYVKVIGGAVIGVGAVAAAPFTGGGSLLGGATLLTSLAGAGTIATAVGAGVAGAVIAANLDGDKEVREQGYKEGYQDAKAEHVRELEALNQKLIEAIDKLKLHEKHFNAIITMHAVAAVTCKDRVSSEKREEIKLLITGLASGTLPAAVEVIIDKLYQKPLNVKDTFSRAQKSGVEISVFDDIIELVLADTDKSQEDLTFLQAWNTLKAA